VGLCARSGSHQLHRSLLNEEVRQKPIVSPTPTANFRPTNSSATAAKGGTFYERFGAKQKTAA
jgi:hypothetical protein